MISRTPTYGQPVDRPARYGRVFHYRPARRSSIREDDDVIDHVSIQGADNAASAAFYDTVLAALGGGRVLDFGDVIGFGVPLMPEFWIGPRSTGEGFRETHIAFTAVSRAAVDQFVAAAVSTRAESLYEPRLWPEYHPGYFGAFVRDPNS